MQRLKKKTLRVQAGDFNCAEEVGTFHFGKFVERKGNPGVTDSVLARSMKMRVLRGSREKVQKEEIPN